MGKNQQKQAAEPLAQQQADQQLLAEQAAAERSAKQAELMALAVKQAAEPQAEPQQQAAGIDWESLSGEERHKLYHSLRQEAIRRAINDPAGRLIYERELAICKGEIGWQEASGKASSGKRINRFALAKQAAAAKA